MEGKKYKCVVAGDERVLVSEDIQIELELNVIAAVKTYLIGQKSMDLLLKQYGETWRKQLENPGTYPQPPEK